MIAPGRGPTSGAVPLASMLGGARARLVRVEATTRLRARLMSMGLRPGVEVRVVRSGGRGPFVLAMDSSRIVLGRSMAHCILVTPLSDAP